MTVINGIVREIKVYTCLCACIPEECDGKPLDVSLYRYNMPIELFRKLKFENFGKWSIRRSDTRHF